jgi:hypothetical protein
MGKMQDMYEDAKQYLVAGSSAGQRYNGVMGTSVVFGSC